MSHAKTQIMAEISVDSGDDDLKARIERSLNDVLTNIVESYAEEKSTTAPDFSVDMFFIYPNG